MKRKTVYVRTGNRVDQFLKTPTNQRGTYKYRFHKTEIVNGKISDITEEIEIITGEDGITEEEINSLYATEDSEVYYNINARVITDRLGYTEASRLPLEEIRNAPLLSKH